MNCTNTYLQEIARGWLRIELTGLVDDLEEELNNRVPGLVRLLASIESRVLKEVADKLEADNPKWLTGWANYFRQQAKERQP